MGQLLFKKCFWDAIRGGTKRTTLRRWAHPRVKPGGRAFAPGVGWLCIESVDVVRLEQLTDADALADGFPTTADLLRTLRELYPGADRGAGAADDGRSWFRVAFRTEAPGARVASAACSTTTTAAAAAKSSEANRRTTAGGRARTKKVRAAPRRIGKSPASRRRPKQ